MPKQFIVLMDDSLDRLHDMVREQGRMGWKCEYFTTTKEYFCQTMTRKTHAKEIRNRPLSTTRHNQRVSV